MRDQKEETCMDAFTRCRWLFVILLAVAVATLAVFLPAPAFAQSVTADPSEYQPGNTVTIIGTGWQPGETVSMLIHEEPTLNPDVSLTATAGANGNFMNEGFTVPDNSTSATTYTVTASGSSGFMAQAVFTDPAAVTGSLCAEVTAHGASVCVGLANDPAGVLGQGKTHYAQVVGSTADYQIRWAETEDTNYVAETSTANGCAVGQVLVQVKSSAQGNQITCGNVDSSNNRIINFSWAAANNACQTTIVAYRTGTTPGGNPQFTNTNADVIEDDSDDASSNASAGIGYVASSTPPLQAISCASVTTQIHDSTHTVVTSVPVGETVHDKATVTGTTLGGIPTGTVTFTFYTDGTCSGTGTFAGTVTLDSSGVAHPSTAFGPLAMGDYSFQGHYNGGNYDPADGACEPLTVTAERQTGSLTACKYEDANANGANDSEPALAGWSMTINVDNPPGGETATQVTDSSGCVTWNNLAPTSYTVTETAAPSGGTPWFNTDPGPLCLIGATNPGDTGIPACAALPSKSATVISGDTVTVSFGNLQSAQKHGQKFYDANANGLNDDGQGVNGWKVTLDGTDVLGPIATVDTYTGPPLASGDYSFVGLLPGSYTVAEGTSSQSSWLHTTPTSISFTLIPGEIEEHNDFGNLCLGAGGGLTLGFWSNKNGRATMNDGGTLEPELLLLRNLHLRNANGSDFDPTTYAQFRTWLLNATATNMAYMLSAQLAAMALNVEASFVGGSSLVYAPGCGNTGVGNNYITINGLIGAADAALAADGDTRDGDPNRAGQECLKNALDRANNNLNFVQPTPTTCPVPTFP